jgi:hypothetical protein
MAILLRDSCDSFTNWVTAGSPTISSSGHTGNAFSLPASSANTVSYNIASGSQTAYAVIGFWINVATFNPSAQPLIQFRSDSGATLHDQITLYDAGSGQAGVGMQKGGTVLGGSVNPVGWTAGTWAYIELGFSLSTTLGWMELRCNGVPYNQGFAQVTNNGGTKTVYDQIRIAGMTGAGTVLVDDIYIRNDQSFGLDAAPIISSSSWTASLASSVTVPAPGDITSGNLLLVAYYLGSSTVPTTWTPPAGWAQVGTSTGTDTGGQQAIFAKTATGSEPSTYTFATNLTSTTQSVVILQTTGYSVLDGLVAFNRVTSTTTAATAPSQTPSQNGDLSLVGFDTWNGRYCSFPTGMALGNTARYEGGSVGIEIFSQVLASSGATGTISSTLSGSSQYTGWSLLLTPIPGNPSISTLIDRFSGSTISSQWHNPAGSAISVSGGFLQFTTGTTSTQFLALQSVGLYDLTNAAMAVQIVNPGNQNLASLQLWPIYLDQNASGQNILSFVLSENSISCWKRVSGVDSNLSGYITYDPVAMQWLRIREAAGAVYWETAPDGQTWSTMFSVADPFTPINNMWANIIVETYNIEPTSTVVEFDNVNATPSLSSTSLGNSTARANLSVTTIRQLPGQSQGHSGVRGAISVNIARPLVGRSMSHTTMWGNMGALVAFTGGQSEGHARVWSRLATSLPGVSTGHASSTGQLRITNALPGRSKGDSTVRGSLSISVLMHGPSAGRSTVRGRLGAIRPVVGRATGSSQTRATLVNVANIRFVGSGQGHATARARLQISPNIVGRARSTSTSRGHLLAVAGKLLNPRSMGRSQVTGQLSIRGAPFTGWGTPITASAPRGFGDGTFGSGKLGDY